MTNLDALLQQLDSFDPAARKAALEEVAALRFPEAGGNVNLHFHSFFSYNAEGWSPSRIALEARKAGLYAAGLCDFDVLDGLAEFLDAGDALGLRATVNLETRAYFKEYADVDISSPGEPGVTYIMGAGFTQVPEPGTPQAAGLQQFRDGAQERNLALVDRVNPHVAQIAIDYAADVLPLTPLGVATERHIVRAYVNKANEVFGAPEAVAGFWAGVSGKRVEDIAAMLGTPAHEELVRAKLIKSGGVGYVQPTEDTFPLVDDFIAWVRSCGAIPMVTWLDGTSGGESDPRAMLSCTVAKGAAALNIIPDRNWNLKTPEEQARKVANLEAIVTVADEMGLPINIGTEMNKAGLPFVDDLAGPVLARFKDSFLRGARIMVGHTILGRFAGRSYVTCECDLQAKNDMMAAIGALPPVNRQTAGWLRGLGEEGALAAIKEAAGQGSW